MSAELKDFPKIRMNDFIAELASIIEGKYYGEEFLFAIKDGDVWVESF